ncbi:hypothetical protein DAEQUDRAFT_200431 [Daedalea quercina L-15889]|uniref:F-box domain-containing protein n=1 Tax=Daedalea quercina L-15889 TaxID=1314783 RepID=A0A165U9F1_9APHY|nr:hypothetical protein DAEQUDRAFT_200431 [Daedalea quercina L-15889]
MPPRKIKKSSASSDKKGGSTVTDHSEMPRKNGGKTARGRGRGGLQDMLNMPTDIVQEIMRRLHPRDLLSLCWSSKSVHAFLMKRSSAYIWKQSMKNARGLPPCPEQLIEPAWVALLFSSRCTGCGTDTAAEPIWELYARFCNQCAHIKLVESEDPRYDIGSRAQLHILGDVPMVMFTSIDTTESRARGRQVFLRSEVEGVLNAWVALSGAEDEFELATFIGTQILRVLKTAKHATLCIRWVQQEAQARRDELAALEDERLQDVVSRL